MERRGSRALEGDPRLLRPFADLKPFDRTAVITRDVCASAIEIALLGGTGGARGWPLVMGWIGDVDVTTDRLLVERVQAGDGDAFADSMPGTAIELFATAGHGF